ncbi:MAG: acyl-CoA dehydrogenase [Hellea sp.]|nr:acyl-CoA dehydrogenase [Hellea sp.]
MTFKVPVNAKTFLLKYAVDIDDLYSLPQFADVNEELVSDILSGGATFAEEVLAPINREGDLNPAQLTETGVVASPGFKEAYRSFVEAGWLSLSIPEAMGGAGMPSLVSVAVNEMIYASNMSFGLCPMLTSSAAKAIAAHASDELKAAYLPKMTTGEWSGAMDLTEPQAGSDLGPIRTKAVPNSDGTYAISGQKIFITWGDHDCAENIIHLVLARLPDAPAGSKGISLFLCPKFLVNKDGSLGKRNNFQAISLEHKIGIHASPTCVMEFSGATGWLVGEANRGLSCMFTMMNEARLFVGVQGVAIGERAYQAALSFSKERVQGRVINGEPGDPIIGHPDVRRMLLDMKTRLMGARAICMATAKASDIAGATQDEDTRKSAHKREALLTPIAKSYGSDIGVDTASIGVQVHGGMGFIEETGAAQHYRDSRIAPIYEGTNGIQAIDLVGRKLRRDGGEGMTALLYDLNKIHSDAELAGKSTQEALMSGIATLEEATKLVLGMDELDTLSIASNYLELAGHVISGGLLIRAACKGSQANDPLAENMMAMARYHSSAVLPKAAALLSSIKAGAGPVFAYPADNLVDL